MKKTLKLFGLVALAAIAFSCTKKDNPVTPGTPTDVTTPTEEEQTTPSIVPATDGGLLTSFGVTIGSEATKVSVDLSDGTTAIENGDEALVFASDGNSAIYIYDETQAQFVLKEHQTAVTVNTATGVYYPADEYEVGSAVQLTLPAGIPASGDLGAINPMAGVITGEEGNYSVTLNNLTSVLRVKVNADVDINSVALDFGSDVKYATGAKFTVNPTTSELTFESGTITSETINLGTPAQTADVLFLLPAIKLTNGLTVTANLAGNHNGGTDSFSISKEAYTPIVNKISTLSFYAGLFSGGAGTAGNPYIIANARDFKYISKYCAEGYGSISTADFLAATYKQTAAIDFKGADLSNYMIASASAPFTGTYDGDSKTLSNFTISGSPSGNEGVAPFKAVNNAVLQNIAISGASVTGGKFTAGLVGYATGAGLTIQNCSIEGSTIADTGHDYGVGGLIGGLYGGTVTGCSGTDLTISTTASGKRYFGGLISYINGYTSAVTVSGCELNGTTTITNAFLSGGIVGQINKANVTVTDCHNHSNITASSSDDIGGILGYATVGTVSHCSNDGKINGANYVAGIIGQFNGKEANVTNCVNTGDITASSNCAGGVVAHIKGGNISNCRSDATVIATGNAAGGLIGGIEGSLGIKVQSCFAKGNVKGTNQVGGFVGNMQADAAYIVNSLAAANVVATGKEGNQGAGGFVGYLKNATNGKNAWIGNCAVYDVIVKAPNQTSNTSPVRIGGFAGVHNFTTTRSNSMIQNCYYQGVAENLGYRGGDDFTTKPTTINGGYHGGIAGYSAGYLLDCYSTPKVKANGSGGTYTNNQTLTQEFIYGNTNSNPAITTSTSVELTANTVTLGGVLSAVDATYSTMAFSDWDSYAVGDKYYYYPASLTGLGEAFYKK